MRVLASILVVVLGSTAWAEGTLTFDMPEAWDVNGADDQTAEFKRGVLTLSGTAHRPLAYFSAQDFENFDLTFEFKVYKWCASGLMIHGPRNGAYRAGIEIELSGHPDHKGDVYSTGAIFRVKAPEAIVPNTEKQWRTCRVRMAWPQLFVQIDDAIVQNVNFENEPALAGTLRRGAVGFLHNSGELNVRNFSLSPLPDTEGHVTMFNGRDLDGWTKLDGPATFEVVDGVIRASGGNGYLQYDAMVQNFDLRMYVRTSPGANGGVFFRWQREDGGDRGTEIQIWDVIGGVMPTASVYGIARADDALITPGEWQLLQISARDGRCTTYLNGVKAAETDALPYIRKGYIVLQMHSQGWIDFRDPILVLKDE
ncbi:MAG: hypothetical protein DHS20C16_37210 [Phycisphaerae bacterium]|nr:MAG: hypothetical protein DHS20C16_37210 [Phycisphaerae bacterium]